jgi:hypothetical protein
LFRNALTDVTGDLPELAYNVLSEETRDRHADTDGFRPRIALCTVANKTADPFNALLGLKLFMKHIHNKTGKVRYNATMERVHVTNFAVEKQ